jgi:hypothetical protein
MITGQVVVPGARTSKCPASGASTASVALSPTARARARYDIFGHANTSLGPNGVVGNVADITQFHDYVAALLAFVEAQHKAGKSRDEILAMRDPLPGFESFGRFGNANPRDSLTCAYEEVTSGSSGM